MGLSVRAELFVISYGSKVARGAGRRLAVVVRGCLLALRAGIPTTRPQSARQVVARARQRIGRGEVDRADQLLAAGLETFPSSAAVRDLRVGTLDRLGQPDRALEHCGPGAHAHLIGLGAVPAPTVVSAGQRRLEPHQRVFLSGYFYSGSGAVLDWLRGFEGSVKWTPGDEMRLVKFPGGLDDLVRHHGSPEGLAAQDLVNLYLHLTGAKITLTAPGVYDKWEVVNRSSQHLLRDPAAAGYVRECLTGLVELLDRWHTGPPLSGPELETMVRGWVRRALDAAAVSTNAELLLVDQGVTAWRLPIARLVPPSRFVIVHRDPRDQFAEARLVRGQPGRVLVTAESFAKSYRKHRALVDKHVPRLERDFGHRFLRLSFEDFVLDHAEQSQRVREFLDLADGRPFRARFRPEKSQANVGKYPRFLTAGEAETLATALPEFLHPRVG